VFLSVITFTVVDFLFGIPTPKLNVPDQVVPTHPSRYVVNFTKLACLIPLF